MITNIISILIRLNANEFNWFKGKKKKRKKEANEIINQHSPLGMWHIAYIITSISRNDWNKNHPKGKGQTTNISGVSRRPNWRSTGHHLVSDHRWLSFLLDQTRPTCTFSPWFASAGTEKGDQKRPIATISLQFRIPSDVTRSSELCLVPDAEDRTSSIRLWVRLPVV